MSLKVPSSCAVWDVPRVTGGMESPSHPSHFFVPHVFTSVLMTRMRLESPCVAWLWVLGDAPCGMQSLLQGLLGCCRHIPLPDHQKPSPRPVGSPMALGPCPGLGALMVPATFCPSPAGQPHEAWVPPASSHAWLRRALEGRAPAHTQPGIHGCIPHPQPASQSRCLHDG